MLFLDRKLRRSVLPKCVYNHYIPIKISNTALELGKLIISFNWKNKNSKTLKRTIVKDSLTSY
jgi:hypothetical protein